MWGDTLEGGGDTRVKAIKAIVIVTAMSHKSRPGFSGKNKGVTPSVTARVSPTLVTPLK